VLVGTVGSSVTFASLATLDDADKTAVGDPATVPAGRYAQR
jgi:ABC-type molybdate transport system substrate-binding protein